MRATSKLVAGWVAATLFLAVPMATAGLHGTIGASLAARALPGQSGRGGASSSDKQKMAEELLRQARDEMRSGNLELAASCIDRAERLNVKNTGIFAPFQDSPEKARRDLEKLQKQGNGESRRPSMRFLPTLLPHRSGDSSPRSAPTDPFQARRSEDVIRTLSDNDKASATRYLQQGRDALAVGDLMSAIGWYHKAAALDVDFAPSEYSPQQLAAALRRAGVQLSSLSSPTPSEPSGPMSDPSEAPESAADRIPSMGRSAAFAVAPPDRFITNPYAAESTEADLPGLGPAPHEGARFAPDRSGAGNAVDSARGTQRTPDSRKDQALALLARARAAMQRGDLDGAEHLALTAKSLNVPESAYRRGEPRPWAVLLQIQQMRNRTGRSTAPGGRSGAGADRAGFEDAQAGYPVRRAPYVPSNDRSRTVGASFAEEPAAPEAPSTLDVDRPTDGEGLRLFRLGEQSLRDHQAAAALGYFRQAWGFRNQLDAGTLQHLQTYLQDLQGPRAEPRPLDGLDLEEADIEQQRLQRQKFDEVFHALSVVDRMRRSDPKGVRQRLERLRADVEASELQPSARRQLTSRIDRAVRELDRYIEDNRAQIELDETNRRVHEEVDRERQNELVIQDEMAKLVENFNRLMKEQQFAEAEALAKQAELLDPQNPIVENLKWKSRFVRRLQSQMAIRDEKEEGFVNALESADESSIPFDDRNPIQWPDLKYWSELTERRARLDRQHRRLNQAELEIQDALKEKVDVRFTEKPLSEVVQTLAAMAAINVHLDPEGLAAEGVTSDTAVTINLTEPISLGSALKLILEPLHLSYVIQDEVLKITSEQTRQSTVYARVYNVADLVIPIPNFVPNYNIGLPGAIRAAHDAIGYGPIGRGLTEAPLTVLANSDAGGSVNPLTLAQIGPGGAAAAPGGRAAQPVGFGPGGLGAGAEPDFDQLVDLITTTIEPESWVETGGNGTISHYETNLSLVISTTQEVHEQIVDLLEQLRRLQDLQVTIEVRFITLADNFFERIGVDFAFDVDDNLVNPPPTDPATGALIDTDFGPSVSIGLQPVALAGAPISPTADFDLQFRQGSFGATTPQFGGFDPATAANFGFAILSDIEAFFVIQAAQGDTRTNILQAPKVTLFNGQQAFVSDTSQTPFVTSVVPVVGDFAAAHQPVITVLTEGTSLSVQAVVSPDRRFIRLTVVPFFSKIGEVKTFTFQGSTSSNTGTTVVDPTDETKSVTNNAAGAAQGTTVQLPTFSFVTVTTTVSVPDGGTVLLGGIKRLSEGRREQGVPLLSNLPYIDRLFRNTGIGRETSTLMMMVTPRIIIQEEEEERMGIAVP